MSLTPQRDQPPTVSGYFPVYVGNALAPVIGYWNSRDARWYVNGLRVAYRDVSVWLGPDPLPERKA